MCLKFIFLVLLFYKFYIYATPAPRFGKFEIRIEKFQMCKGPKGKDCAIWDMQIVKGKLLIFNVTTSQKIAPLKVKVVMSSNGKELVRLQMARVCENVFMKPLFAKLFNANNQCVIPKGTFHYELDMQEIFRQYYGGEFLYGNALFKTVLNNEECNFSCTTLNVTFAPNKS